jgi:hypothetical protein
MLGEEMTLQVLDEVEIGVVNVIVIDIYILVQLW